MALQQRVAFYKKMEELRGGRPLIVYVTSTRPGAPGIMASDAIAELLDQIEKLPEGAQAVDLLVVSNGGDPTVAWRAMSLLRERVDHVAVLVPQAAFSAATLLAMGADEIIMHPNGNLGPVDPQITVTKPGEPPRRFGYEDLNGFLEFAKEKVGLSDQEHLRSVFDRFCKEVGAVPVGVAARSSALTLAMGEKLLRMHMKGEDNLQRARGIAEKLNKAYFYHGYPLSRSEARTIGLNVTPEDKVDKAVEKLMWEIWQDIEADLKIRKPFAPIHELMASPQAKNLLQPRQSLLPLGQGLTQQLIQNIQLAGGAAGGGVGDVIKKSLEFSTVTIDPVDYQVVSAVMESCRVASRHVVNGKVISCRMPDLNIQINAIPSKTEWEAVQLPAEPVPADAAGAPAAAP